VITNILEARLLTGSESLFQAMEQETSTDNIWPVKEFFAAKRQEQERRYQKYHETTYNLEPNIKDGPGGLRDIQTIAWVAKRHFNAETLYDLVLHGFLTEEEYQTLHESQSFLWKIRTLLHEQNGRHEDNLAFDYQRTLAKELGYSGDEHKLDVEVFMRQFYRTTMDISRLNEMLLQSFQEDILHADESDNIEPLNKRFQVCNGFIEVTHDRVFEQYPFALLEIFLLMQDNPEIESIRAGTGRLLRHYTYLIDDAFRQDLRARNLFMEILRAPIGQTKVFRAMSRYGILAAYLPEFGRVVGQMQYDLFHVYTVDQHTLFVLRNLRRFTVDEHSHEFPLCSQIIKNIPKLELLYLGGLFHDIAKGRGGDHSELGQQDALEFCKYHGFSDHDSRLVAWLVKQHLVMSTTAQREDISDPEVVNAFARKVGDTERLDYLYLMTVADIRGTNPKLWNSWKDSLLADLYHNTRQALLSGLENPIDKHLHVQTLKNQALNLIDEAKTEETQQLWRAIDDSYFLRSEPDDIARETIQILARQANEPLVCVRPDAQGSTNFLIYTDDREALFSDTVFALEQQHVNVVDAYIIAAANDCSIVSYSVLEESGEQIQDNERIAAIQEELRQAAAQHHERLSPIRRRQPRQHKHFTVPTRITFNHDYQRQHTLMEVLTNDRPGVLSRIVQALVACDLRVKTAKIATFGSRVEDVFYITDRENRPLQSPQQFETLQRHVKKLLEDSEHQASGIAA
ncbi:MAG: [protein-PII] uridylyltransferase, partial [Pseudomonadota bacterium]